MTNKSNSNMEILVLGLAIVSSAILISDYLKERKAEKEDERYQKLCRLNNWTQEDQDKYGNCDFFGLKMRYAKEHNITIEEVSNLMLHGKVGFCLNVK